MAKPSRQLPSSGKPQVISELLQKGLALHQSGRAAAAALLYEQVLKLDGAQPAANHLLGLVRLSEGKADEAVTLITRAVKGNAGDPQYLGNLGVALNAAGQHAKAVAALDRAIAHKPDFAEAYSNKGMALRSLKRFGEAVEVYRQAVRLKPAEAGFHFNLANSLRDAGYLFDAESAYRRAVHLRPRYAAAINGLAAALDNEGRAPEVLELLDRALKELPNEPKLHLRRGRALYHLSRLEEAAAAYRRALELDPRFGEAHLHLSYMVRHEARDWEVDAAGSLFADEAAPAEERIFAGFALGKALTDLDDHEGAIAAYLAANTLNRQIVAKPPERATAELALDTQRFEGVGAPRPDGGFYEATPIFVVGLPRSGKTTIETILSRHPAIEGVGELPTMARLVAELRNEIGDMPIADVPSDRFTELGRAYMREAQSLASPGMRIVDTLPANFRHVGFIRLALPNARIIRSLRPRPEHIIAVYEKYFTSNGYEWSNDLDELSAYHAAFETQMATWNRLFVGRIYEIDLLKLRADRKGEINRLLDFCGLGWAEACMGEARSEPQIGDWPADRIIANREAHYRAWRAVRPELWR
jgi:tetratricopeptide (TPR) repeat protein